MQLIREGLVSLQLSPHHPACGSAQGGSLAIGIICEGRGITTDENEQWIEITQ